MYTEQEMNAIAKEKGRRTLLVLIPTLLVFFIAIGIFVYGQIARSDKLWMLTTALTILSIGALLFFYGTWIKPVRLYEKHIRYMLHGKQVSTTGYLKEVSDDVYIQETLPFFAVIINVGEKNDPEDDRLFYYDAQKDAFPYAIGEKITITSNDRKISKITKEA